MNVYRKVAFDVSTIRKWISCRINNNLRKKGKTDFSDRPQSSRSIAALNKHKAQQANALIITLLKSSVKGFFDLCYS